MINRKAPEGEYVTTWDEFEFLPGALDGLRMLASSPLTVVVATNQRGVALGRMTEADLADIHRRMVGAIREDGGRIDAIYHCPHDAGCACRKPEVGMFEAAARDLNFRLRDTAVVGDSPSDMLAATRIGALAVLVNSTTDADVDHVAHDLPAAARWLLEGGTD